MRRLYLLSLCALASACGDPADDSATVSAGGDNAADTGTTAGVESSASTGESGTTDSSTTSDPSSASGSTSGSTSTSTSTSGNGDESGGSSGSESDDTRSALPRGQWAMTEITYTEGGESETLTMQDRAFCDATEAEGTLQLRYQQADGYTVWLLQLPQGTGVGSHTLTQDFSGAYMNINEVSDSWQAYFDPSMAFGTLVLTDAEIQPGGVVAGTLTATLTSNDGSTTADFQSTFYAEIP